MCTSLAQRFSVYTHPLLRGFTRLYMDIMGKGSSFIVGKVVLLKCPQERDLGCRSLWYIVYRSTILCRERLSFRSEHPQLETLPFLCSDC